jgi:transcription elongation factor Elf1
MDTAKILVTLFTCSFCQKNGAEVVALAHVSHVRLPACKSCVKKKNSKVSGKRSK